MNLDNYRWLVSDAAVPWLARVRAELVEIGGPSVALLAKLRKNLSSEQAHLVVEQCELRARAGDKFSRAEQMFFTRQGLEQATDEQVAESKAVRFPQDVPLADLCCGIGGDLLALAARTPTRRASEGAIGVEHDLPTALLAAANLAAYGSSSGGIQSSDAAMFPVQAVAAWHIDPDRRSSGRRTTRVEQYEPPLETLERLLAANANAALKLAPAADAPDRWRESAELAWYGSRGECRQQVAWFGSLGRHLGQHSATVVDARGGQRTIVGSPAEAVPVSSVLGHFLYEPHAAVLAAKLSGALCCEHSLAAVSAGIAYLTADELCHEPLLAAFEVVDVLPFDQKQLKAYLRERRIGRLEVKKRGVDIDPARLRKTVIGQGDESATLIVAPVQGQIRVIVARRVSPRASGDPAA